MKVVKVPLAGRSRMWLPKVHPSKAWRGQHQPLCDPHICTICPGMPGDAMLWPPGYRSRQGDLTPRPWQGRRQSCPVPLTTSSTFTISYTRFTATNGHSAQGEAHRRQMLTAAPANLNTTRPKGAHGRGGGRSGKIQELTLIHPAPPSSCLQCPALYPACAPAAAAGGGGVKR